MGKSFQLRFSNGQMLDCNKWWILYLYNCYTIEVIVPNFHVWIKKNNYFYVTFEVTDVLLHYDGIRSE